MYLRFVNSKTSISLIRSFVHLAQEWHRVGELNTINYQSLSLFWKRKKKVREKKGRTETSWAEQDVERKRGREREEKIRFEAAHALPARNGVSVIYGGHSRLELSLSENMFTPGVEIYGRDSAQRRPVAFIFPPFVSPRTSLFRFYGTERGRGRDFVSFLF